MGKIASGISWLWTPFRKTGEFIGDTNFGQEYSAAAEKARAGSSSASGTLGKWAGDVSIPAKGMWSGAKRVHNATLGKAWKATKYAAIGAALVAAVGAFGGFGGGRRKSAAAPSPADNDDLGLDTAGFSPDVPAGPVLPPLDAQPIYPYTGTEPPIEGAFAQRVRGNGPDRMAQVSEPDVALASRAQSVDTEGKLSPSLSA